MAKIRFFLLLTVILVVSSVLVFPYLKKTLRFGEEKKEVTPAARSGTFALSLDGEEISWEEFDDRVGFARSVQGLTNQTEAEKVSYQSFLERKVLQDESGKRGLSVDEKELSLRLTQTAPAATTSAQLKIEVEASLLKEKLLPLILSRRSGRYLMVNFGFERPDMKEVDQKELASKKMKAAYERIKKGEDFGKVGRELNEDAEVKNLNGGDALLTFDDWPRTQELYSDEFTEVVFKLKKGEVTPVTILANDPEKWGRNPEQKEFAFVVATVDSISQGGYPGYEDWLADQIKQLEIVSNLK